MLLPQSITDALQVSALAILAIGLGVAVPGTSAAGEIAIKGYDTVSYFTAGKAQRGTEAFSFLWRGKTWYFTSTENRDLFAAGPERYAPQYDGFCAWAMTEERKAIPDPEVWKIVDGKLYLNCSQSAYEKWARDIPGNIRKADQNWRKMQEGK